MKSRLKAWPAFHDLGNDETKKHSGKYQGACCLTKIFFNPSQKVPNPWKRYKYMHPATDSSE
jgi:hypothetical protein